ncbi:MAG: hypothetical protein AMXMBFR34_12020 [Myxococcaceae bacterium]
MNRRLASLLAASLLLVSSTALAQAEAPPPPPPLEDSGGGGGGAWSVYSGRTLHSGNVFAAEVGWPGLNASFYHGAGGFDIGGRFTFNYGTEMEFGILPALNLHFLMRFGLLDRGMFTMALQIEPGVGFFFTNGAGMGIYMPVALQMGIHPISALAILMGIEVRPQIGISFGGAGVGFYLPLLFVNPGVEYALTSNVALTFRMAFGPGIVATRGGGVVFAFRALMGVTIKL